MIVRDLALGQDHAIVATRLGPNWIILDNRWLTLLQDAQMRRVVPLFVLDHDGPRKFVHQNTNGDPVVLLGAKPSVVLLCVRTTGWTTSFSAFPT